MTVAELLTAFVDGRTAQAAGARVREAAAEIAAGVSDERFCALISLAARAIGPRAAARLLAPDERELDRAAELCEGWSPERWTLLETVRVRLVLARPDLARDTAVTALEEAFRYADVGELCSLYRSLAFLPQGERFVWRAGEGCRTNMRSVFEACACDTPYPARHFDDVAWRQLVIKCIFIGAPLWRVHGLDRRLSPELARMALDLADERRSAGRPVQHELWLCLGEHAGSRGLASLERELETGDARGRAAAAAALVRAGEPQRARVFAQTERDPLASAFLREVLAGDVSQAAFRALDPAESSAPAKAGS